MSYVEGFVVAVPAANKEAYRKHAADAAPMFKEFGARRMVEAWGDNVPDGKLTDFKGAVKARPDEVVVFSWFEYPDKAARDAANKKIMSDPRMKQMGANMPFDGQRMIFGGFAPIVEEGAGGNMGYADGFLVPVPAANKEAYRAMAAKARGDLQGIRRHAGGRSVGRRRARRQGHRLQGRGEGHGRREDRLLLDRMAVEAGARRGLAEDHARRADEAGPRQHAVRRQAHDLWRLHADRRRLSSGRKGVRKDDRHPGYAPSPPTGRGWGEGAGLMRADVGTRATLQ